MNWNRSRIFIIELWKWFIIVVLMSYWHVEVESLASFRFGRHWQGFVGEPNKLEDTLNVQNFSDNWFDQQLDHFSSSTNDNVHSSSIWKQRYFVNEAFYISNNYNRQTSPIFLMISGESEASRKWMHQGAWIHYAEQFGALCFQVEHRFYGQSHPTRYIYQRTKKYRKR